MLLELKSFIQPAEPREIVNRSEEIRTGIEQIRRRRERFRNDQSVLYETVGLPGKMDVYFAVASESSIGAYFVHDNDVAVVNVDHLIRRLSNCQSLRSVGEWLCDQGHLPVEGTHFEVVERVSTVGEFELSWYGLRLLVEDLN